jgi:uncharacterized membrane protein YkvA (DUF1232 family)
MELHDVVVWTLVAVGALLVVGLVVIGLVMWRYKIPPRGVVAMVGALFYLALPLDVLPEALLGPLGLVDDAGVVTVVAVWVYKLAKARQRLVAGGVLKPGAGPDDDTPSRRYGEAVTTTRRVTRQT